MGYAYGKLELTNAAPDAPPVYYVRVWRHDARAGAWSSTSTRGWPVDNA